ncbi:MAG: hypothetical protein V4688_00050 [Pseudomonadota bacterium]
MTSYFPDFEAIEREKRKKQELGYLDLLEAVSKLSLEEGIFRSETILEECVAAGLVWDSESMIVSKRDRGVTGQGDSFLELSENFCSGPWRTFYVKPSMLQSLLSFLDNNLEARAVVQKYCETRIKFLDRKKTEKTKATSVLQTELPKESEKKPLPVARLDQLENKVDNEPAGCMQPIVGIGSWLGLCFFLVFLEQQQKGLGASVFGYGVLAIIGFFTLKYLFAAGVQEAGEQFGKLVHGIVVTVVLLGAVAMLGQCSGGGGDPTEMYYRK